MMELDDYRFSEDKITKIQALWRGIYVRQQMKKVQDEYVKLFKELENNSALEIQWTSVLSRPRFLSNRDKLKSSRAVKETMIHSNVSSLKAADARLIDEIPELERPTHNEDVIQFPTKSTGDAVTQTSTVADSLEHRDVTTEAHLFSTDLLNPSVSHHPTGNKHHGHAKTLDVDEERCNLALELLWIQQAIVSRKQYLHHKTKIVQLGSR